MSNLQKIIYLTKTQYDTLAGGGTVGSLTGLNDEYLYCTTNDKILIDDLANDFVLPVSNGGTGTASFTIDSAIISGSSITAPLTTRAITNITTAATNPTANTDLITANTLMNYKGTTNIDTLGIVTSGTWSASTIEVNKGGTGVTSLTANSLLMSGTTTTSAITTRAISNVTANATITSGTDIPTLNTIYYGLAQINNADQSHADNIYAPTSAGTANQILVSSGGTNAPTWLATAEGAAYATTANGSLTFGTLPIAYGGTNNTTFDEGCVLYYDTTNSKISSTFLKYSTTDDVNYLYIMPSNTNLDPIHYINQNGIIQGSSLRIGVRGVQANGIQWRAYDSTNVVDPTYQTFDHGTYSWGSIYCQVPCKTTANAFVDGPQMYFLLRSKSNSASTSPTTNGYAEYYYLPRPANSLTASQTYYLYTTKDAYKIISCTAKISVNSGALVNVQANSLTSSTTAGAGYSPIAISKINTGNSNINVQMFNAQATGTAVVVCLKNTGSSNYSNISIEVRIVYLRS